MYPKNSMHFIQANIFTVRVS